MPLSTHPRSSRRLKNFRPARTPDPDPETPPAPWRLAPPSAATLRTSHTHVATPGRSPTPRLPQAARTGSQPTTMENRRALRPLAPGIPERAPGLGTGRATIEWWHGPCAASNGARKGSGTSSRFLSPAAVRREEFLRGVRGGPAASLSPPRPQARRAPTAGRRPRTWATSQSSSTSSTTRGQARSSPTRPHPGGLRYRGEGRSWNLGHPGARVLLHRGRSDQVQPLNGPATGPGPTLQPGEIGQRRAA